MATFAESLRIFDAGNAAPYAGELFREAFNAPFPVPRADAGLSIPTPPENWRQYVALYRWPDGREETVGFCNWIKHGDVYLEGGMCVQKSFYRRMPREHFRECNAAGGIAQMLMDRLRASSPTAGPGSGIAGMPGRSRWTCAWVTCPRSTGTSS
jgi:hypothetical protein